MSNFVGNILLIYIIIHNFKICTRILSLFKRTFILSYIKQFKLVKGDKKFYILIIPYLLSYIIDDIDSKFQAQLEQGVDTAVESKLKKDMALLESFFNKPSLESLNKLTGMTVAKLVEFYSNNLRRLVQDGDFTEQEAEVISSYLDPYSTINKVPIKSRYEMLVEIIKKQQFKDYTSLMAQRLNEEITVTEYNKEIEHYKEIYDLLLKTLELTNKNKGLKDASSVWGGFSAISWQATESVRRANAKKSSLTEEREAIYNPPSPPVQVQEKAKKTKQR